MNSKILIFLVVVAVAICAPYEKATWDKRDLIDALPGTPPAAVAAPLAYNDYPFRGALSYSADLPSPPLIDAPANPAPRYLG